MTWFREFRGDFGYSNFGDYRTSVTWDISLVAIVYTCLLISLAAIIAATGIRGKEKWYTLIRLVYSLAVGSVILVSIYGYCWKLGEVGVHAPYIYRTDGQIQGSIGVHIGLKTVNLTLQGTFQVDGSTFNYNEELILENVLKTQPQIWGALSQGLPQPLLSVIEHFDIDAEGLRFGRAYFMAGYFANILLWSAFAFWVTSNILLYSVIWYAAVCFTLTGVCMVMACVIYDFLSPTPEIRMPCSDGGLTLTYGWCFWSTLVFGCVTTVIGLLLFMLDHKVPKKLAQFFLLDTTLVGEMEDHKPISVNYPYTSAQNTPDTSLRHISEKKKCARTPINWYVNYGLESPRSSRSNPMYNEPGDVSYTISETLDPCRPRAYSDIIEEEDRNADNRIADPHATEPGQHATEPSQHATEQSLQDQPGDTRVALDADANLDRLGGIYCDVEPNHKRQSQNKNSQPYIKELDAMIETR